jgi:hypothetical protein
MIEYIIFKDNYLKMYNNNIEQICGKKCTFIIINCKQNTLYGNWSRDIS